MTISINPVLTTNAADTFSVSLDGFMQGMAMDDPAVRYQLTGGQLAPTETQPMFGGVPIYEQIPPLANPMDRSLQNLVGRATAASPFPPTPGTPPAPATMMMTGISVFNQNHAMINYVTSPVPQADVGMLVNFYRFGSRARIPMNMDPAMQAAGSIIYPASLFYWNIANQWVTLTAAGGIALPPTVKMIDYNVGNSMVVVYNATTGFATWNRQGNAVLLEI
jgi:hypothetical protein